MREYKKSDRVLGLVLEDKASTNGDKILFRYKDQAFTYAEVHERSNRVGNAFWGLGVRKGGKVGIMLPNCAEYLDVWFGLAKIGGVEVPINTAFKGDQLLHVLNSSDVSILVVDRQFLDRIEFIKNEITTVEKLIIHSPEPFDPNTLPSSKLPQIPFEVLYQGSPSFPGVQVRPMDLMAIMHTSGTTGSSKGVMLCHGHELLLGWNTALNLRLSPQDVYYHFYPFFHNTAQAIITIPSILADASFVLKDRFSLSAFWEDIRNYGCTVTHLMGALHVLLLKQPEKPEDGRHPLRVAQTIGGSAEVDRAFEERFHMTLLEVYGGTEQNVVTYNTFEQRKPGSCGKVWPGFEVKVFDEEDRELPPGEIGEIVTRTTESYTMCLGYYRNEKATLDAIRNFWYHTGDAGYFDEEGYLYFVDRVKDAIRRKSEFISSYDVETVVNSHPAILESAAVGIPVAGLKGEQEVKVVVVLKDGAQITPEELIQHCEQRLAYFALPRFIEFRDTLPKTTTEKVEKHKLKAEGVTPSTWDREKAGYKLRK